MLDHTVFWANLWMPGSMYNPLNPWVQNFGFSGSCCYPTKTYGDSLATCHPSQYLAIYVPKSWGYKPLSRSRFKIYIYIFQIMPQQSLKDIEYSNLKLLHLVLGFPLLFAMLMGWCSSLILKTWARKGRPATGKCLGRGTGELTRTLSFKIFKKLFKL